MLTRVTKASADQRGASAILVAASLLMLMGVAAIAVDAGAGFNLRRESQNAADLAALAAATNGMSEQGAVTAALAVARSNIGTTYTNAEWQNLWQTCTDPDRPAGFSPVDDPWSGSAADRIQCISSGIGDRGQAEIRVRIPERDIDTAFGRVVGVDELSADAVAHAGLEITRGGKALPFGILNGTPMGTEQCIIQPPGGHAVGACSGPTSGNFGAVEIPLWGSTEKSTTPSCNPGAWELSVNIAIGSDHIIAPAVADSNGDGIYTPGEFPGSGGPHPGDANIVSNGTAMGRAAKLDACTVVGGDAQPTDPIPTFPLNTLDVDTGLSANPVKLGLIGDTAEPAFPGGAVPRLRQTVNSNTIFVAEKDGSSTATYEIDNTPLWLYLRDSGDLSVDGVPNTAVACNRTALQGMTYANARDAFLNTCLPGYMGYAAALSNPPPLFVEDLAKNPRFAWAPMFQFTTWGSGNGWQPIHSFTALYIDGIWFNCNGNGNGSLNDDCGGKKGLEFFAGELVNGNTYTGKNGGGALNLRLDQLTAITIPVYALPQSIAGSYPGSVKGPFTTGLLR